MGQKQKGGNYQARGPGSIRTPGLNRGTLWWAPTWRFFISDLLHFLRKHPRSCVCVCVCVCPSQAISPILLKSSSSSNLAQLLPQKRKCIKVTTVSQT